jgi:exosortase A-associated hydrolase 2
VTAVPPCPLMIDGRLFAVLYAPVRPARRAVLVLPPFAEEMNRSRRVVALLGRALAANGVAMLALDPFGTGDSAGDLAEASWPGWRGDAVRGVGWLRDRSYPAVVAMGLRTGAVLAMAAAAECRLGEVVLWQPVTSGARFLTQLLRIRTAASLPAGAEGTAVLAARLKRGETLEVAGYPITAALAAGLETLDLDGAAATFAGRVEWFHLADGEGAAPPPSVTGTCERWRGRGLDVRLHTLALPHFWSIEEPVAATALIEATASLWLAAGEPA